MFIQESNDALLVTNKLLHKALAWIKCFQLVSQALQQHSRNTLVILLLLLSVATKVWETMNNSQAPQWECVCAGDSHMESHPFFPKTKGFVAPGVAQVSQPQPINAITPWLPEEDPEDESTTTMKKSKLAKHISRAIITDTEDEDGLPARPTIFVKPHKGIVPVTPAPSNSKAKCDQGGQVAITKLHIHRPTGKDKGKKKVVEVKEPELYDLPCAKCSDKHKCVITYGVRGLPVKACDRCFTLKVKCEQPADNTALTDHVRALYPWSKATLVSKSKPALRMTRVTSHAHPSMSVVEFKDTMDDADVTVAAHENPTHIAAMTPMEPKVNQPAAIASADDFPADHWQEDPDTIVMPPPFPPYFLSPLPYLTEESP
ncbi:hypothetical protein BDR04DRAFT_1122399 [Suillus decipiens]|nr:hypothetical protein BDR04DRAFT_1122399 [Suillus decipiens]